MQNLANLSDIAFGSAGCIEIIGNYDLFKKSISDLSGTGERNYDDAIQQLVNRKKLIVVIEGTVAPDIRKLASRKIPRSPYWSTGS